jgi:hypothetical protein
VLGTAGVAGGEAGAHARESTENDAKRRARRGALFMVGGCGDPGCWI